MNKNKLLLLALPAVLFAFYSGVVFSLFDSASGKFWPAYLFTILAVVTSTCAVGFCISKKNLTLREAFLNLPLIYVSCFYALGQLILSILVMSIPAFGTLPANLSQAALLALYALLALSAILGANIAGEIDQEQASQTLFVRVLSSEIEAIAKQVKDVDAKNKLQKLYEAARYSDPVSHETLTPLESVISARVGELSSLVASGGDICPLCEEIAMMLGDRNSKCKFLK